ncbi:Conserved hypothetical protein [Prochlorococcus marinus str. MIT 9313]|uniref:Uncharacterized protein n=2 Tax=Prochlorococcus marinus TaxID=1219 RepID=B9ESI4_PROMM|nr:Conserved hypothetical protein [Prochlorococcus marinus str. MIT 9303]CAX32329.1 Conserved hypothetical protein [Prochlorococcus marinus str. MIT 9313]
MSDMAWWKGSSGRGQKIGDWEEREVGGLEIVI